MTADTTVNTAFSIASLALTSPNGGEVFPSGSDTTIMWTTPLAMTKFKLSYSVDSGITWLPVGTGFVGGNSMPWMVPLLTRNKTKCLVRIKAFDASNKGLGSDNSNGPFTIEVLTVTDPASNGACTSGQPWLIAWDRSPHIDAHSG